MPSLPRQDPGAGERLSGRGWMPDRGGDLIPPAENLTLLWKFIKASFEWRRRWRRRIVTGPTAATAEAFGSAPPAMDLLNVLYCICDIMHIIIFISCVLHNMQNDSPENLLQGPGN